MTERGLERQMTIAKKQLHIEKLKSLFHPKSIALVGVPRETKSGTILFKALLDQGFPGPLYPINPKTDEIGGFKAYPSLKAVKEPIDMAILMVPNSASPQVLEDCIQKEVKLAVLFTSGYGEKGTAEGKALEHRIHEIARSGGMRLLGPNCMGFYSPEAHLSNFPQLSTIPGKMGFIAQSGSLSNIICTLMPTRNMFFSMSVSTGNELDLNSGDFLEYLGQDERTHFIVLYLEGIKDGRRFLKILKKVSRKKPVLIWKVGASKGGSKAALSHTGSIAGSRAIWESIFNQTGAIGITGINQLIDVSTAFYFLTEKLGPRMGIISGPGSLAVAAAEACEKEGLQLAPLDKSTINRLVSLIPKTGTSPVNPVDVGFVAAMDMDFFGNATEIVGEDPSVDALILIGGGLSVELNKKYKERITKARKKIKKPILIISLPGIHTESYHEFFKSEIPVFDSVERAASSYAKVLQYQRWREKLKNT